jgi:hypothetical protein
MEANMICELANSYGVQAVSREFRISRRQAEELLIEAHQLTAAGAGSADLWRAPTLTLRTDDSAATGASMGQERASAEPATRSGLAADAEVDAQLRAARIKRLDPSHRTAALADLERQEKTMIRSINNGYTEWIPQVKLIRRIKELVGA